MAEIINPIIRETLITFNSVEKTVEDLRAELAEPGSGGHRGLVAEAEGVLLGYASYKQFRGGPGYARTAEHSIALAPLAQGRGVGRALMHALEEEARTAGMHSMIAGVSAENPGGRAFHARIGYAQVAVLAQVGRKFDRWLDLILMQKLL
jgi:phosphinothricin acetyltransferase